MSRERETENERIPEELRMADKKERLKELKWTDGKEWVNELREADERE